MKLFSTCLFLLTAAVSARGISLLENSVIFDTNSRAAEARYTAARSHNGENRPLTAQNTYNGWVNPEDLPPMPQCISQQNQSTCCLAVEFSSDVLDGYLSYCDRSILAKAQLYLWIRDVTGRTWLVNVGDTNELQSLSPASLAKGYEDLNVIDNAPTCLTGSASAQSMELFQHIVASCMFTSTTQHTGNAARPWEYSESRHSIIALDSETAGYDLARDSTRDGNYFDKKCFCSTFTIDWKEEPCSGSRQIDLTKERLWINATCGSTYLPDHWADTLQTTGFAYIAIEDWHWPMCLANMPEQAIGLPDQCMTDACELDSSGYCKVKRTVDRGCFCRDIRYHSYGSLCQVFETRIDYVKWLHDLCGNVQDWHGLPDNWRQLAKPTALDMIPWRWTLKPSNSSNSAGRNDSGYIGTMGTCASNGWKLGSFALINIATFVAALSSQRTGICRITHEFLIWRPQRWGWFIRGAVIAALQLLANWFNVFLVQNIPGYENVPRSQLMILWCSMPRLAWLMILLVGPQRSETMNLSAAASSFFAEMIIQFVASYYMLMTVNYGRVHDFYLGHMEGAERGGFATIIHRTHRSVGSGYLNISRRQTTSKMEEEIMAPDNKSEETPLMNHDRRDDAIYGTFFVRNSVHWLSQKPSTELYEAAVISMFLLWIAQWLFWVGFIGLSSEEFCPPRLGVLTAVWIAFSVAGAAVGAA
ncbi:hypothetical protein PMAA_074980 [Paecilomyces variotii No. 5]|uniref:Integral membrane protein n=1 Tax=Byssochlamys spectabilis (strain No. 5 / NBRC 109023) TaxID=1356009 RepID=V5HSN5_BYSSN|nr:hypothetical protein PMAA_074980 [Paecilomyces variotii No. 5]